MEDDREAKKDDGEASETSTEIAATWNTAQEDLLAAIADRANCCRWLHARCQVFYDSYNFWLTIPSIVIGTIAGSATIGLPGMTSDPEVARTLTVFMGVLTLSASVFTSVNQYMRTSQLAEGHRISAVSYGKMHRLLSAELALRRDQRQNAGEFLKYIRAEQDRLQDTSPIILDNVIRRFNKEFKDRTDLEKPEIAGDLDHVSINRSSKIGKPGITPIIDFHDPGEKPLNDPRHLSPLSSLRHIDSNATNAVVSVRPRSADVAPRPRSADSVLLNMLDGKTN